MIDLLDHKRERFLTVEAKSTALVEETSVTGMIDVHFVLRRCCVFIILHDRFV